MTITLAGGAVTWQPDDDQLSGLSIELAAFDGEVGNGTLPIADQSAILTVATGRQAKIEQGATLISDGFMLDQDRERGPVPAGTARLYNFGLADANALLDGFRVTRSHPFETDYARVMAFAAADGPAWDTTWVLNASTVMMPAKKYDGDGGWGELITDVVEFTGKTLWLHDLADGSGRCLHYHVLTTGHTCGLSISDVIPEDGVTNFYPWNPIRQRTSIDLRNDIKGRDQSGRVSLASDATSIATHDADGLQHQALIDFDAASQSDLNVKTAAYLASQKDDLDTYTCLIGPLDATALALIRPGDRISVTSTVMGLTASVQRISHMTLTPAMGAGGRAMPDFWMIGLELGAPIRRRARVKVRRTQPPLEPYACVPQGEESAAANMGTFTRIERTDGVETLRETEVGAARGRLALLHTLIGSGSMVEVRAFVEFGSPGGAIAYRLSANLRNFNGYAPLDYEVWYADWATVPDWDEGSRIMHGTLDPAESRIEVAVVGAINPDHAHFVFRNVSTTGDLMDVGEVGITVEDAASDLIVNAMPATDSLVVEAITAYEVTCVGPVTGQTYNEVIGTGDGGTAAFDTTWPYRPGTLTAYLNDLPEFQFVETDGDTITFDSPPFTGETVRVVYQGA